MGELGNHCTGPGNYMDTGPGNNYMGTGPELEGRVDTVLVYVDTVLGFVGEHLSHAGLLTPRFIPL